MNARSTSRGRPYGDVRELAAPYLGTEPDAATAARFGVSRETVRVWRDAAGIDSTRPHATSRERREIRPLLGTTTDVELAMMFGFSAESVRRWRVAAKIPAYCHTGRRRLKSAARPRGKSGQTALMLAQKREAAAQLFGTMVDAEVALAVGVNASTAREWRIQAGVAPYRRHRPNTAANRKRLTSMVAETAAWATAHDDAFTLAEFCAATGVSVLVGAQQLRRATNAGVLDDLGDAMWVTA